MESDDFKLISLIYILERLCLIDYLEEYQYMYWSVLSYYKKKVRQ